MKHVCSYHYFVTSTVKVTESLLIVLIVVSNTLTLSHLCFRHVSRYGWLHVTFLLVRYMLSFMCNGDS